jgi:hypothetical protein
MDLTFSAGYTSKTLNTDGSTTYVIPANASNDVTFGIDKAVNRYSVQYSYTGINGTGTMALYQSLDGTNYNYVYDNLGAAITRSVTGAASTIIINNFACGLGKLKLAYVKGTNSAGTISITVLP